MQLTAKLIHILPLQSGNGRNGEWRKQDIIVETQGEYPKKICISLWGDKINSAPLNPNDMYTIDFDVESREYNGRWYTDVKAWKIVVQNSDSNPSSTNERSETTENPFMTKQLGDNEKDGVDDLPF